MLTPSAISEFAARRTPGALGHFLALACCRPGVLRPAALLVAGLLLAALTAIIPSKSVDEPLLRGVQSILPAGYEDTAWFFNVFLRNTGIPALWAMTVVGFLLLRRNDYAARFVLTVTITAMTTLLKQTIDRPRPAGDFTILQLPTDPSFPSGHTMTALAFFGLWFIVSEKVLPRKAVLPVRVVCVLAVVMTGLSRVWVGAHWPTDVLGALVWGSLFLLLVVMTHPMCEKLNTPSRTKELPI
jgi:undecaprenyl-diphosphatase